MTKGINSFHLGGMYGLRTSGTVMPVEIQPWHENKANNKKLYNSRENKICKKNVVCTYGESD